MPTDAVLDVSSWPVVQTEAAGSKGNRWLEDPDGQLCLFKPNRFTNRGLEQGEDWAELLAYRLAHRLGIPAAVVHMVRRRDDEGERNGSISYDLVPAARKELGWEMQNGSVLLQSNPRYQGRAGGGSKPPKDHIGHNLQTITDCLSDVGPPIWPASGFDAHGTFAGYLALDALIGNQDRHEENWGVLGAPDGSVTLAPSYDHGASLGFLETDTRRSRLLTTDGGVLEYATKGKAKKFEGRATSLVVLAHQALAARGETVRDAWLDRLGDLSESEIDAHVQAVPRMSDLARTFCYELLVTNRRRLLDVPD